MSDKTAAAPRKTLVDAFVAKDRVAVFWFLMAVLVACGCAFFLMQLTANAKAKPPFVMMDGTGTFIITQGVPYRNSDVIVKSLSKLAVETLLNRSPAGLANKDMLNRLCTPQGRLAVDAYLKEGEAFFGERQIRQTYQITDITVGQDRGETAIFTKVTGDLHHDMIVNGSPAEADFTFEMAIAWVENPDAGVNGTFPALIGRLSIPEPTPIAP